MNKLITEIEERKLLLSSIIKDKTNTLKKAPPGKLRISNGRFYLVTKKTAPNGTYIRQENPDIIKALAQKAYNLQVLKFAQSEFDTLSCGKIYTGVVFEDVYDNLSISRQSIVTPDILTDELYTAHWDRVMYDKRVPKEGERSFTTDNGESVHSKIETIIANKLRLHQLHYRYEFPVKLKNGTIIHPDFTILDIKRRRNVYWEHFGLMDKAEYADNSAHKIHELAQIGIVIGKNLIVTLETLKIPMRTETIDLIIRTNFL